MTARVYSSPPAFKAALEQRLKATSKDGVDFARRRQLLVFDRFLARISVALGNSDQWVGAIQYLTHFVHSQSRSRKSPALLHLAATGLWASFRESHSVADAMAG
jgi:hypothetical protein